MVETILKMKYSMEYNAFNIKNIYIRYKYCLNSLVTAILLCYSNFVMLQQLCYATAILCMLTNNTSYKLWYLLTHMKML